MQTNLNSTKLFFVKNNLTLFIIFLSFFFGRVNAQTSTSPSGTGSQCDPYLISSIDNLYWITQNSISWASGKYFVQTANIDAAGTTSWNSGAGFPKIGTFRANYDGRGYSISNITMNTTGGNSGIFGYLNGATVKNLNIINPTITFSSGTSNGVLAGVAGTSSTITNVHVNGGSFTNNGTGFAHSGFVGDIWGSTITSCSTSASVTSSGMMTGGFVGRILGASTFNKCSASSTLNIIGSVSRIGGFAGQTEHSSGVVTFNECYSSGSIIGSSSETGGFIGLCYGNINFNNCYASIAMPNVSQASGFWSSLWTANSSSNSVNFNNCYSVGLVTNSSAGGFGSSASSTFVYSNCFWDNQSSTKSNGLLSSTPTGLTGKTTLEMKTQSTFSSSGWDFSTKWAINGGVNNGYPSLIFPAVTISTAVAGCPIINVSGTTSSFTTCNGTPSSTQSVTVSGSSLSANITVTAPTGFEISTSSSSGFGTSLTLIQSGGSVTSTIVYIRLTGAASGSPTGNVSFTSTNAPTHNITVSGTVLNSWTGATNNLWNEPSNWSCAVVPDGSNNIEIPTGTPILNIDLTLLIGNSITINGTGAIIIAPGKTLTIAGSADFGGKAVIFQSDATGSGQFGPLTGTLTGANNIQVERYIPSKRAFRFLSPSVTTTTSIRTNWQENAGSTAGLGTHITGNGGATNGFDATTTNNPSMFGFDSNTGQWSAVTNTNVNTLTAGTPYRLMVRGDRTTDLTSNTSTASVTTLRATGALKTGNFTPTLNQSADGFSLIGNPYQAPIDIKAILTASTNMSSNVVYYWDPTLNTRGGYVTRNLTTDVNDVTSSFNQYVQPGQAVFVKKDNTANVPTMTITEANKSVANAAAGVFRNTNTSTDFGLLRVNLQANNQTIEGALALFNDNYTWNVTSEDATKMSNLDEEVSFVQNNTNLAIALQSNPSATSELPIKIDKMRHTNYQWQFELNNYNGATPYLYDNTNNSYTQINNGTVVPFTADSNTTNRFKIVFQNGTLSTDDFVKNIKIYPNPTKTGASFYVTGITEGIVSVFNVVGQNIPVAVMSQGNAIQVTPTTTLSQGIYLVSVITTDGKTAQVKWIVE